MTRLLVFSVHTAALSFSFSLMPAVISDDFTSPVGHVSWICCDENVRDLDYGSDTNVLIGRMIARIA